MRQSCYQINQGLFQVHLNLEILFQNFGIRFGTRFKGEYVAQPGVVVKIEELNHRNETHEFMVIENNRGIPQSLNHACDPVILLDADRNLTLQDIQDVQDIPEEYGKTLSEREFDLNDIYIGKACLSVTSITGGFVTQCYLSRRAVSPGYPF